MDVPEILSLIFKFLPVRERHAAKCVCRTWRDVVDDLLWPEQVLWCGFQKVACPMRLCDLIVVMVVPPPPGPSVRRDVLRFFGVLSACARRRLAAFVADESQKSVGEWLLEWRRTMEALPDSLRRLTVAVTFFRGHKREFWGEIDAAHIASRCRELRSLSLLGCTIRFDECVFPGLNHMTLDSCEVDLVRLATAAPYIVSLRLNCIGADRNELDEAFLRFRQLACLYVRNFLGSWDLLLTAIGNAALPIKFLCFANLNEPAPDWPWQALSSLTALRHLRLNVAATADTMLALDAAVPWITVLEMPLVDVKTGGAMRAIANGALPRLQRLVVWGRRGDVDLLDQLHEARPNVAATFHFRNWHVWERKARAGDENAEELPASGTAGADSTEETRTAADHNDEYIVRVLADVGCGELLPTFSRCSWILRVFVMFFVMFVMFGLSICVIIALDPVLNALTIICCLFPGMMLSCLLPALCVARWLGILGPRHFRNE